MIVQVMIPVFDVLAKNCCTANKTMQGTVREELGRKLRRLLIFYHGHLYYQLFLLINYPLTAVFIVIQKRFLFYFLEWHNFFVVASSVAVP
jgi:hypothetical protein